MIDRTALVDRNGRERGDLPLPWVRADRAILTYAPVLQAIQDHLPAEALETSLRQKAIPAPSVLGIAVFIGFGIPLTVWGGWGIAMMGRGIFSGAAALAACVGPALLIAGLFGLWRRRRAPRLT